MSESLVLDRVGNVSAGIGIPPVPSGLRKMSKRFEPSVERVTEDPDRELVDRWKAGDESAFADLVVRHEARVFRLLMGMMGNREEAEDVGQEAFLSLYRHGKSFRNEARFSTFVYRVAANAALNRRRSLGRARTRLQRLMQKQAAGDHLPESPTGPAEALESAQTRVQVQRAIETLSPRMRMALVLFEIEGLSYAEISEALDLAPGTVKSRIHRARDALRRELKGLAAAA